MKFKPQCYVQGSKSPTMTNQATNIFPALTHVEELIQVLTLTVTMVGTKLSMANGYPGMGPGLRLGSKSLTMTTTATNIFPALTYVEDPCVFYSNKFE